jgi:hypothetical protein
LYPAGIERRCDMREVDVQPQSWTVDDDDDREPSVSFSDDEEPSVSFSYARV